MKTFRALCAIGLVILLVSCSGAQVNKDNVQAPESGYRAVSRAEYQAAMREIESGANGRKLARAADSAGHYLYNQRDFKGASKAFFKMVGANPGKELAGKAQFMLGKCFFELEDYAASLSAFDKVVAGYQDPDLLNRAKKLIELIVEAKLSLEQLILIEQNYRGKAFYPQVLFQLGKSQYHLGDCELALRFLGEFLSLYPTNSRFEEVKWMLDECRGVVKSSGRKIGCLLPLSGSLALSGEMMRNGIELAVEEYNQKRRPKSRVVLLIEDTSGDHLKTLKAARRLIEEEKVAAIIGPASSECLSAVATLVNDQKVPLITPSAGRLGLTSLSKYIFRNHLIISEEGSLLARHAIDELGLRRFAIIAPDNYYGKSISQAFRVQVVKGGGEVVLEQYYTPGAKQFKAQMTALGGVDPGSVKSWKRKSEEEFDRVVYNFKMKLLGALPEEDMSLAVNLFQAKGGEAVEGGLGRLLTRRLIREAKREEKLKVLSSGDVAQARERENIQVSMVDDLERIQDILRLGEALEADLVTVGEVVVEGWELQAEDELLEEGEETPGEAEGQTSTAFIEPQKPYIEIKFIVSMQVVDVKNGEIILTVNESFTRRQVNPEMSLVAEAVFVPAYAEDVILLAPMLKHYGLEIQVLGNGQWGSKEVRQLSFEALEGVIFVQGFFPASDDRMVKSFNKVFEEKYGKKPDQFAAQAYDAGRLIVRAMHSSGGARLKLAASLAKTTNYKGVSGRILRFDENGDAVKELPILKIRHKRVIESRPVVDMGSDVEPEAGDGE